MDLNGDGEIDQNDTVNGVVVSGVGSTVGITPKPPIIDCGPGKECKLMSGSSGGTQTITESADKPSGSPVVARDPALMAVQHETRRERQ